MKFSKENMKKKTFPGESGEITVHEYENFPQGKDIPMDGAIAEIDGDLGEKRNNFCELLYIISGKLEITEISADRTRKTYIATKDDTCIIEQDLKHHIKGKNAKVFIVCNPAYQSLKEPYVI